MSETVGTRENMTGWEEYIGSCALLDKRPKQPCTIADCHRCGACLRLGCPALERGADGAVRVNAALCNGCGLCKQMCAFGCITGGGEKQ